jgi:hypothetical protein
MTNESLQEPLAMEAFELDERIRSCNVGIRAEFLRMAEMLTVMEDGNLYLLLDCPTFESYLGTLGPERDRSWLFKLMRAYRLFSKKLSIPDDRLLEVGPTKLDIIAPVVNEGNVNEWLDKTELSKSDLINEVRKFRGKSPLSPLPHSPNKGFPDLAKYKTYLDYVRDQPCCVCGATPVDAHHFPLTRASAGREGEEWTIPLCRACHTEYHTDPVSWTSAYKHRWAAYIYGLILLHWGYRVENG